ncbi:MAG TPA: class I SAM-dependent methyltransferase [Verrucomicrobiae bacterium]|nr:class I SAM-dependent methyltransferase [Verrucomicrobiae bacterium]
MAESDPEPALQAVVVSPVPDPSHGGAGAYDFPVDLRDLASAPGLIARHVPAGATVLDIGCASANLLAALRDDRGCQGVGLEIDPDAVAAGRARGLEVHRTDCSREPLSQHLDGRRFARIVLADVLEHLVDPAALLAQVPALLEPGGRVLVSVPNITHFDVILAMAQDRFTYTPTGLLDRTHLRFFTLATFAELAQACGLTAVGVERHIAPPLQTELWGGRADLPPRYVAMLEQAVRAGNPNADVYQFIVVLEPRPDTGPPSARMVALPGRRHASTPELTLLIRPAAQAAEPDLPDSIGGEPTAPDGAPPIAWIRLDPTAPFGAALMAALGGVHSPACAVLDAPAATDPALLRRLHRALESDPELVAACVGPVAPADLAGQAAHVPGRGGAGALPRWDRTRLLTGDRLRLRQLVLRTSALRLAIQSVAALGPPFLAALDDWTVVARMLQWGEVGVLPPEATAATAATPSPPSTLPLAIALGLVPLRPDELVPPRGGPGAGDVAASPAPASSPPPQARRWLRRRPRA